MVFTAPEDRTVNLSNGTLVVRYRSEGLVADARISFERAKDDPLPAPTLSIEIFTRLKHTKGKEETREIVLPATPALRGIREISITFVKSGNQRPVDLTITAFEFIPFGFALEPVR